MKNIGRINPVPFVVAAAGLVIGFIAGVSAMEIVLNGK